ncbi:MAG: hypothetical protein PVF43_05665 [Candidatus Eiseniibacteriota bacterium]
MRRRTWTRRLPPPLTEALRDPATLRDRLILALVLGAPVSARGRADATRRPVTPPRPAGRTGRRTRRDA